MKELKDFIHLYLGCEVKTRDGIGKLIGIVKDEAFVDYRGYGNKGYTDEFGNEYDFVFLENEYFIKDVQPILRTLDDMTDTEQDEYRVISKSIYDEIIKDALRTKLLLSKYFDLFELHEAGLCLYETDLK